jgi:hypothetical protein
MTLRKWAAMYVWGIAFDSFYDFSIGIWNCYDMVALFIFCISSSRYSLYNLETEMKKKQTKNKQTKQRQKI